jgi:hypothetical protein
MWETYAWLAGLWLVAVAVIAMDVGLWKYCSRILVRLDRIYERSAFITRILTRKWPGIAVDHLVTIPPLQVEEERCVETTEETTRDLPEDDPGEKRYQ